MIVILGGGPAGRLAAMRLASAGREVKLIEKGGIGGQCLHFGCMPVCALNDVARLVHTAKTLNTLGLTDSVPRVNFPAVLREMQNVQSMIASVLDTETREAGVEILYGKEGRFDGKHVVVGDEKLDAESVILATGSRPNIPAIAGIGSPGVFTPHTLRNMTCLPERLAIIGGGIVAAEFAWIFSRFGSEVTVLSRSSFLKTIDEHLRKRAVRELSGVHIRERTDILEVEQQGGCLHLGLKSAGKPAGY